MPFQAVWSLASVQRTKTEYILLPLPFALFLCARSTECAIGMATALMLKLVELFPGMLRALRVQFKFHSIASTQTVTDRHRPSQALCIAEAVPLRLDVECTTRHKLFVGDESNGSGMRTLDNGFLGETGTCFEHVPVASGCIQLPPGNPTIPCFSFLILSDLPGTKLMAPNVPGMVGPRTSRYEEHAMKLPDAMHRTSSQHRYVAFLTCYRGLWLCHLLSFLLYCAVV